MITLICSFVVMVEASALCPRLAFFPPFTAVLAAFNASLTALRARTSVTIERFNKNEDAHAYLVFLNISCQFTQSSLSVQLILWRAAVAAAPSLQHPGPSTQQQRWYWSAPTCSLLKAQRFLTLRSLGAYECLRRSTDFLSAPHQTYTHRKGTTDFNHQYKGIT